MTRRALSRRPCGFLAAPRAAFKGRCASSRPFSSNYRDRFDSFLKKQDTISDTEKQSREATAQAEKERLLEEALKSQAAQKLKSEQAEQKFEKFLKGSDKLEEMNVKEALKQQLQRTKEKLDAVNASQFAEKTKERLSGILERRREQFRKMTEQKGSEGDKAAAEPASKDESAPSGAETAQFKEPEAPKQQEEAKFSSAAAEEPEQAAEKESETVNKAEEAASEELA